GATVRRRARAGAAGADSGRRERGRPTRAADHSRRPARGSLDQPETGLREAGEDRVAVGALVVPFQVHLTHQVGARLLEPRVPLKRAREPADAALAADSTDLDRLRL